MPKQETEPQRLQQGDLITWKKVPNDAVSSSLRSKLDPYRLFVVLSVADIPNNQQLVCPGVVKYGNGSEEDTVYVFNWDKGEWIPFTAIDYCYRDKWDPQNNPAVINSGYFNTLKGLNIR